MNLYLKGALVCLVVVVLLALVVVAVNAGAYPPYTIKVRGAIEDVYCYGPCCCGTLATVYHGAWYEGSYYKWFKTLRDGDIVTATVMRAR